MSFSTQCVRCKNFDFKKWMCPAFPDGIPPEILEGDCEHTVPFKGDHGIMFEQIQEKSKQTYRYGA